MNLKTIVETIHKRRPFTPYSMHMFMFPLPCLLLGAFLAPAINWLHLVLLILAYWIGLEVGVHNLDLSTGWRPKKKYAPFNTGDEALWPLASARWGWSGIIIGLAIAIALVAMTQWWLILFVIIMLAIAVGYGKDIWPFHTYTGFGLSYGMIPVWGSYLLQVQTFDLSSVYHWGVIILSAGVGVVSAVCLSYLPRSTNPVDYISVGIDSAGKRYNPPELEAKGMVMKGLFIIFGATWLCVIGVILMRVGG